MNPKSYFTSFLSVLPHLNAGIVIAIVALTLRLAVIGFTFHGNTTVVSWEDVAIANNLLEGKGYSIDNVWRSRMLYSFVEDEIVHPVTEGYRPTTLKPPIYPFILVLLFSVFGVGNFVSVFVLSSIFSAGTALFLYLAFERQSKLVASLISFTFSVYPPFVFHSATTPESTPLLLFLISLFLYQSVRLIEKPTTRRFFVIGITGGLLVLTNPISLPFVVGSTSALGFLFVDGSGRVFRCISASGLALVICISPWIVRNYLVFHRPVMKSVLGHTLLKARFTSGEGLWVPSAEILKVELEGRHLDEVQEDSLLKKVVIRAVKHEPGVFVRQMSRNFLQLWWEPYKYQGDYSSKYILGRKLPYAGLFIFSLWPLLRGVYKFGKNPAQYFRTYPLQSLAIFFMSLDTFAFTVFGAWNIRYHFPSELLLLPFFAEGVITSILALKKILPWKTASQEYTYEHL